MHTTRLMGMPLMASESLRSSTQAIKHLVNMLIRHPGMAQAAATSHATLDHIAGSSKAKMHMMIAIHQAGVVQSGASGIRARHPHNS